MMNNVTVDLESMTASGECLARHAGMALFVAMGIPGERVEVKITHRRKTWGRARITRVLVPSPLRVAPPCVHFGHCNGCEWQHIDYAAQVRYKTDMVRELLAHVGGLPNANVSPCIPSPIAYGYRNRIQLIASRQGRLGYRARHSHHVVEIEHCPIAADALNALIPLCQTNAGEMVELRRHDAGATATQDESIRITVGQHTYRASGHAFFQVNTSVAALLVNAVLRALDLQRHERVLDVYCGVGLFTVPVANRAAQVTGIEANVEACDDARFNLQAAGALADIFALDAGAALHTPTIASTRWDAIVLNPPRAGVDHATLLNVMALRAPKLVYVSCDPATLARDAKRLAAGGYVLQSAQPFDMFPQTHHVETVAVFQFATPA